MIATRADVDYLLEGLEQELTDGLARLEQADQADDHVAVYHRLFHTYRTRLLAALDAPDPNPNEVAYAALQATWLSNIWPTLHTDRGRRHKKNLDPVNATKQATAATNQARCREIAATLKNPKPSQIQRRWRERFPQEAAPSLTSIRRYLAPNQK